MKKSLIFLTAVFAAMCFAGSAQAQQRAGDGGGNPTNGPQKVRPTNTYGSTETYYRVSFSDFSGFNGNTYLDTGSGGSFVNRYTTGGGANQLVANLQLPAGAMIDYLELDTCEENAGASSSIYLLDCDWTGSTCSHIPGTDMTRTANSGCGRSGAFGGLTPYGPVDNFINEYIIAVTTPSGDGSESLSGVIVGYHLQISPPPGSATFLDVPTSSPIFRFVEALVASGITAGCDATHYCPAANLTRGQMAVYLATALGLSWN